MLTPYPADDAFMEVYDCLQEFAGIDPPTPAELGVYLRSRGYTKATNQLVMKFWRIRHIHLHHPAAFAVLLCIPYLDEPTKEQFLKIRSILLQKLEAMPVILGRYVELVPRPFGLSYADVCTLELNEPYARTTAKKLLRELVFTEVLLVWRELRRYRLPPFPPPFGSD